MQQSEPFHLVFEDEDKFTDEDIERIVSEAFKTVFKRAKVDEALSLRMNKKLNQPD